MRVVAGTARGRTLVAPAGPAVRPTTDRVREAVFNALHSLGAVEGAVVLDAFAGSGALGVEALSRGAAHVVFVDTDRRARDAVQTNVTAIAAADRAEVRAEGAERVLAAAATARQRFDLVLLDPPYRYDAWPELVIATAAVLKPDATVVIESDRPVPVEPSLGVTRQRRYGSTVVTFARRPGADT
jgi:16S rRNA (guanine966-N2)-methyltransferase